MVRRISSNLFTPCTLIVSGCCLGVFTPSAAGQSEPETVRLPGIVRDFLASHPDFNVTPAGGYGHYAGNVDVFLAADDTPIFTGSGFRVDSQWLDSTSEPIAPHLYGGGLMGSVTMTALPTMDAGTYMDTWDSSQGPYGPGNVGPEQDVEIVSEIPAINEPTNLPANVGNVFHQNTVTISSDIHCDEYRTKKDTIVNIDGDVTIFCETLCFLGQRTVVNLLNDSTLRIYVRSGFDFNQMVQVNMNTMEPYRCHLYNLGTGLVDMNQGNEICAQVYSPQGHLRMAQDDHIYGSYVGPTGEMHQDSAIHVDTAQMTVCGVELNDTEGSAGPNSSGGITSAATFQHWFHDTLGQNISAPHAITLVRNASGIYEYLDDAFLPIDDRLYGNEGNTHNYLFTFTFNAQFTFNSCSEYFFEFEGADDAWMFIDGPRMFATNPELALDLGGVAPLQPQHVAIDRLGLIDGETYTIRFFYAQRQTGTAVFRLRTNVPLEGDEIQQTVSAGWD